MLGSGKTVCILPGHRKAQRGAGWRPLPTYVQPKHRWSASSALPTPSKISLRRCQHSFVQLLEGVNGQQTPVLSDVRLSSSWSGGQRAQCEGAIKIPNAKVMIPHFNTNPGLPFANLGIGEEEMSLGGSYLSVDIGRKERWRCSFLEMPISF